MSFPSRARHFLGGEAKDSLIDAMLLKTQPSKAISISPSGDRGTPRWRQMGFAEVDAASATSTW